MTVGRLSDSSTTPSVSTIPPSMSATTTSSPPTSTSKSSRGKGTSNASGPPGSAIEKGVAPRLECSKAYTLVLVGAVGFTLSLT